MRSGSASTANKRSRWIRSTQMLAMVTTAGLAASFSLQGPALASAGMKKAPPRVAAAIVEGLDITTPTKCYEVLLAKSDRKWAYVAGKYPEPRGCPPVGDAFSVTHQTSAGWVRVPISNAATCAEIKRDIKAHGGSTRVWRDFASGVFTCP